ncbi:MAG: sialate O-acetylesterase [Ruminococcaceae bacterium]|nr:sialate O-acetylesterase [Oscillospiraceae bacterium]
MTEKTGIRITELTEDFQVIQRDEDGYGRAILKGSLEGIKFSGDVEVRVEREDDGTPTMGWERAEINGNEWSIELRIPEGGLYRIIARILRNRIKTLYHIGVGDIYVTMGQSNMTGYGKGVTFDPPTLGVHSFANNGHWRIAVQPLADEVGMIYAHPEGWSGSSPALSFARMLYNRLNIPIGIVPAAVGGSNLASWQPSAEGSNYREMMRRLDNAGKIKGIVWSQGCADANKWEAETYFDRFKTAVEEWRRDLGNVPVLTVQLNSWTNPEHQEVDKYWGMVRDAQRRAAFEIDGVSVVPSYDLPLSDGIHNAAESTVIIGERLANAALRHVYGKVGLIAPSIIGAASADSKTVVVYFKDAESLYAYEMMEGFNIEDENGLIGCTGAQGMGGNIVLTLEREYTLPAKLHYAWKCRTPGYSARNYWGYPALACYGIEIDEKVWED